MAKRGINFWFTIVFSLYPFLMIGAYYIGWKVLFYVCVIPILLIGIINIIGKFKYANWKYALFAILTLFIMSEIGYLITKNVIDGICMGCYISLIVGVIESFVNKSRNKK